MSIDSTKQEGGQEKGEIILGCCVDPGVAAHNIYSRKKGGGGGEGEGEIILGYCTREACADSEIRGPIWVD